MRVRGYSLFLLFATGLLAPSSGLGQSLTGTLIGTVRDEQAGVLSGAELTLSSPVLIGGSARALTNERGQLRFQALPPGRYSLEIRMQGFTP